MADKTLQVSGLVGPGIPVGEVGTGVERFTVQVAPAYQFQRSDLSVNWPVVATYTTDTDAILIPGMAETDVSANKVTWQIRVSFLDRRNQVIGGGQAVTFKFRNSTPSTVRFPDQVDLVDAVLPPEYGPTWAEQAAASAATAATAAIGAAASADAANAALADIPDLVDAALGDTANEAVAAAVAELSLATTEYIAADRLDFVPVGGDPTNPFHGIEGLDPGTGFNWAFTRRASDGSDRVYLGQRTNGEMVYSLPVPNAGGTKKAGPNIYCIGDSLTAGAGGGATTYPAVLAGLLAATSYAGTVNNGGVGGESSRTIIGRAGGRPMLATFPGGTIPTSGGVTVTLTADTAESSGESGAAPLVQGSAGVNPVTIAGVSGTLSLASSVYTFTRTTSGTAVPVDYPAALLTAARTDRRGDIFVIMVGQNDTNVRDNNDPTYIISRIRSQIEWQDADQKRYVVMGLHTNSYASRAPVRLALLSAFGRRFLDHHRILSSLTAFRMAALTPTTDDTAAIAAGTLPPSFWANTTPGSEDSTHLNPAGYTVLGTLVYDRLKELGDI